MAVSVALFIGAVGRTQMKGNALGVWSMTLLVMLGGLIISKSRSTLSCLSSFNPSSLFV